MLEIDHKLSSWLDGITDQSPFWSGVVFFCARYLLPLFFILAAYGHVESGHFNALVLMLESVIISSLVSLSLSFLFRRRRPYEFLPDLKHLKPSFFYTPSFPSDHSTVAFAIAGSYVVSYFPSVVWMAMIVATIIALSRVMSGVHYLSDVLVGALIGLATCWFVGNFLFI